MPALKTICPSCGKRQAVPLVWGNQDLLDEHSRGKIARGEMVCGGDAITIDEQGRSMDRMCVACGAESQNSSPVAEELNDRLGNA